MKSIPHIILFFILLLVNVTSTTCKKSPEPITSKIEVTTIFERAERNAAVISGFVRSNGVESIKERGVCWDTITNPSIRSFLSSSPGDTGLFQISINGLLSGKIYYAKAYARSASQTIYGNEISFSTTSAPVINGESASNINYQSCTIAATVNGEGSEPILQKGVCWNTTGNPTLKDDKTEHGPGAGAFVSKLENLQFGTKYYARVYATTVYGTEFGKEIVFSTSMVVLPTLTTLPVSDITAYSGVSGGNITSDGGAPILKRGVCWNFVGNPTPDITSPYQTSDGNGGGQFTSQLQNLYPFSWYGARAFATNIAGTAYGQLVTFNTSAVSLPGPSLIAPAKNALIRCCSVNFSWSASVYAEYYTLQVSKSALFDGPVFSGDASCFGTSNINNDIMLSTVQYGTSYCLKMSDSTLNGTWYWRVRYFGAGSFSAWSNPGSFNFEK